MLTISKKEVWATSDGVTHTSREMAEQYVLNHDLVEVLDRHNWDGQNILNVLSSNLTLVRDWINACNALEKASLKS